jgi:Leucine Rich repeat
MASVGDVGAVAIAKSPHLGSLKELCLNDTKIGDAGAIALAESTGLKQVEVLGLRWNPLGSEARRALRKRFGKLVGM